MRDQEPAIEAADDEPSGSAAAAHAELAGALRRLKTWLIVLTALVALLVAAMIVAAVWVPRAIDDKDQESLSSFAGPFGPTADEVAATREEIQHALGDKLQSLDVRLVTQKIDDPSAPADIPDQQFIYVQFQLKGTNVTIADVVGGPFGPDVAAMGMLPTQGSLQSRMTTGQFDRFLAAYARQTTSPLSNVRRYNDRTMMMAPGSVQASVVKVGEKKFKASDLWAATEGMTVEGDELPMDMWSSDRQALIFYENPKSGAFAFLGTEPAMGGY